MKRIVATLALAATLVGISAVPAQATSKTTLLAALSDITDDFGSIQSAAKAKSFTRLSTACESMGISATRISGMSRPKGIPSASWGHLMTAMDYYMSASDDCVYGADNLDSDSLESAITSMSLAQREVTKASKAF